MPQGTGGKVFRASAWHGDEVLEVAGKQATEVLETLPLRRLDAGDSSVGRGGGKVNQVHHFATDKNKKYTQAFQDVTDKYGLNLDDDRNKALLPHQGRHPNAYHDFILDEMKNIDNIATGGRRPAARLQLQEDCNEGERGHPGNGAGFKDDCAGEGQAHSVL